MNKKITLKNAIKYNIMEFIWEIEPKSLQEWESALNQIKSIKKDIYNYTKSKRFRKQLYNLATIQTYRGYLAEVESKNFWEKLGFKIKKSTFKEDYYLKIDLWAYKNNKKQFGIQVKAVSSEDQKCIYCMHETNNTCKLVKHHIFIRKVKDE